MYEPPAWISGIRSRTPHPEKIHPPRSFGMPKPVTAIGRRLVNADARGFTDPRLGQGLVRSHGHYVRRRARREAHWWTDHNRSTRGIPRSLSSTLRSIGRGSAFTWLALVAKHPEADFPVVDISKPSTTPIGDGRPSTGARTDPEPGGEERYIGSAPKRPESDHGPHWDIGRAVCSLHRRSEAGLAWHPTPPSLTSARR